MKLILVELTLDNGDVHNMLMPLGEDPTSYFADSTFKTFAVGSTVPTILKVVKAVIVEQTQIKEIAIKVKRELFSFSSEQHWVNKARSWFANCGVPRGYYLCVDANGHVLHLGTCFMQATKQKAYPVTVYELQTN